MSRRILAIDLSSARGGIAALLDGVLVFADAFQSERSHNSRLFPPLSQALEALGEGDGGGLIVTGTGPGSYTGVRISIAAAQGVGLARGWPAIGLPSICTGGLPAYEVLGDARRGMFYQATVRDGRLVQPPVLRTREEVETLRQQQTELPWISFDPRPPLTLPGLQLRTPDASALALLAARLGTEETTSLAATPLEPFYLQEAFITTARKPGKQVATTEA